MDFLRPNLKKVPGIALPDRWNMPDVELPLGGLTLVRGADSAGKSRFLLNLIYDSLLRDKKIVVFYHEMSKNIFLLRLLCIHLYHYRRDSGGSKDIFEVKDFVADNPEEIRDFCDFIEGRLFVIDGNNFAATELLAALQFFTEKNGEPDQVYVDYLEALRPKGVRSSLLFDDPVVSEYGAMDFFSIMARQMCTSWVVASQLSDEESIRDAGRNFWLPGRDGSLVIRLDRPVDEDGVLLPEMELYVSKSRYGDMECFRFGLDEKTGVILDLIDRRVCRSA